MAQPRGRWSIKDPRSTIMFTVGLAIMVHEVLSIWFTDLDLAERPVIIGAAVTMMGVTQFLKLDEQKQGRRQEDKTEEKT